MELSVHLTRTRALVSLTQFMFFQHRSVEDPGFNRGEGSSNPQGGVPTYYLAKCSRKLRENEENWAERDMGVRPKYVYVGPPLQVTTRAGVNGVRRTCTNYLCAVLAKTLIWF